MSNNILQPIPQTLNNYLLQNGDTVLSNTTPAAPNGSANINWQLDQFGNISAYTSGSGGGGTPAGPAGTIQSTNGTAFTASSILDNGTLVTVSEPLALHGTGTPSFPNATPIGGVYFDAGGNALNLLSATTAGTGQAGGYLIHRSSNGTDTPAITFFVNSSGFTLQTPVLFNSQPSGTSATAGAATALPATPLGYWQTVINGVNVSIPYYNR